MQSHRIAPHARRKVVVALFGALAFAVGCDRASGATRNALENSAALTGVWDLVSVKTRWPDGHVTEPWGTAPVGRLAYGADGRMMTLLMDARRNQADGRVVPADVQASVAAYYGTYTVDSARHVVTHHVATSVRPSEAGTIERRYTVAADTLVLIANALYEGESVTHTLVWHRVTGRGQ
ncbi:MAG TPA: lipocalin-like domain-containing protein [Gemmatimonadaceae bacterium]